MIERDADEMFKYEFSQLGRYENGRTPVLLNAKQSAIQKARLAPTAAASRKRVFDSICSGKSSSAEIAADVGMTLTTIRRIANGLADDGLVLRKEGFHGRFFYYQARAGEGK